MRHFLIILLYAMHFMSCAQGKADSIVLISCFEPTAKYPGGNEEMKSFIERNLKYPKHHGTVQGVVFIRFAVNEDGSLSEFKVVKGLTEVFDKSALDAVKNMPNWIPAERDNRPIPTTVLVPIKFE